MQSKLPCNSSVRTRQPASFPAIVAIILMSGGCGGGSWPRVVDVPPERVYEVSAGSSSDRIVLPEETPFIVHDRESSQDPGQDGTARGESDAKPDGTASCRVTATAGGSASGDFLIGHVFHNRHAEPRAAVCTIRAEFTQRLSLSASADAMTTAEYTLEAFVRDSSERILRRYPLANSASALGPRSSTESALFEIAFELEPRTAYHVVIGGRATAKAQPGTEASAEIELKQLQMEVVITSANARASSTDKTPAADASPASRPAGE